MKKSEKPTVDVHRSCKRNSNSFHIENEDLTVKESGKYLIHFSENFNNFKRT
jgi:hypothetical protein